MATKASEYMKQDIKKYLDELAKKDDFFALCYEDDSKNLDECMDFIVTQVQKSGAMGFHDDEIYGLAIHYYQEDNPGDITKGISERCNVVINHPVELTEEEKEEARRKAMDEITATEIRKIKEKEKREREAAKAKAEERKKQEHEQGVMSLFGEE